MKIKRILMLLAGALAIGVVILIHPDQIDYLVPNESVHSVVESFGAFAAILMGLIIIQRGTLMDGGCVIFPALGFISMGILDGFHAVCPPGQVFVFSHSIAGLAGGFFFCLIWCSQWVNCTQLNKHLVWVVAVTSLLVGIVSISLPEITPIMLIDGNFTNTAIILNIFSGGLFFLSSIFFLRAYYRSGNIESYLFLCLAFLFGLSGFVFNYSEIWDFRWWQWHVLRLIAYAFTFALLVRNYQETQYKLRQTTSELAERNIQLESAVEDIKLKNKELDEFSYVASHDLQEPLRKLSSFCSLLEKDIGKNVSEQAQKDMHFIKDAAKRMQILVQDLLALSRAGRSDMNLKRINLNNCVDEALEALAARIDETKAVVTRDALPQVWGDLTMMTQLYQNLIGNALKFINEGRIPKVHLSAEKKNGQIIYGVKDNGIGIKQDYMDKVFAPFKRLHGLADYEGTGIGLAICRKTIERHDGNIWVESQLGKGSHFKFTISNNNSQIG